MTIRAIGPLLCGGLLVLAVTMGAFAQSKPTTPPPAKKAGSTAVLFPVFAQAKKKNSGGAGDIGKATPKKASKGCKAGAC